MCDQTEVNYADGDVVWVKLGSCFWPGEVVGFEKLPADFFTSFKKPPIAVVKFFQEDTYEYVKNPFSIFKYECSRKNEFIQKGLDMYRKKHGPMEKFPEDVIRAEIAVGGDIEILTRDEFQETKKESYADLFVDPRRKTPASTKKGKNARGRTSDQSKITTPIRKIKEKHNYQVHILVQGSKTPNTSDEVTPSTSRAGSEPKDQKPNETNISPSNAVPSTSTPTMSSSGIYACHSCPFSTSRLNVLILHNKTHSTTFTPYIPTPIKKKPLKTSKSSKSVSPKSSKSRKPRPDKVDKETDKKGQKREADNNTGTDNSLPDSKKLKTDEEIKSSLLADWDDGDEDSNEEETIATASSPDVPVAAGSPAVPTSAELPSEQVASACEQQEATENKQDEPSDKPESSNDGKYDFCEDEDWPVEADVGRKIPRVKPLKRKEETKSLSIDESDVAREVAELLTKTNVPELPSAPEPLKVEENFPEPSIVKSPDKIIEKSPGMDEPPEKKVDGEAKTQKPIFKTKTFFRSRHSRSQDAIGKYVAEQLNAAERLDMLDNEINGSETSPSPEPIISQTIEHVKVARLAPKIQLKKMNAEAAQLREKEKYESEKLQDGAFKKIDGLDEENSIPESTKEKDFIKKNVTEEKSIENITDIPLDDITNTDCSKNMSTAENTETNSSIESFSDTERSKKIVQDSQECLPSRKEKECMNEDVESTSVGTETQFKSYISDSTASAVDALLSVSREADRVTKVISVDPPEDLFEDDNKESITTSNINTSIALNGVDDVISEVTDSSVQRVTEDVLSNMLILNTSHNSLASEIEKETKQELSESKISQINTKVVDETDESEKSKEPLSEKMHWTADDKQQNSDESKQNDDALKVIAPSESDLQIAETLINLPSTTMQNKVSIDYTDEIGSEVNFETKLTEDVVPKETIIENTNIDVREKVIEDATISNMLLPQDIRFESEKEKSENLNAAQSLVQMSESIDHKISVPDAKTPNKDDSSSGDHTIIKKQDCTEKTPIKLLNADLKDNEILNGSTANIETTSKLLKILEEPSTSRVTITNNPMVNKKVIVPTKGKILNTHANKSMVKPKQVAKPQIIIRRTTPSKLLNNVTEVSTADKIILSRTNKPSVDGSAVQSYTIQTTPKVQTEKNTIIIQPKIRKITKTAPKLQKIKPQITSVPTNINKKLSQESAKQADSVFDINSMPIVLSDDVLTPESIEKMPIVMSDGNIITSSPSKVIKNRKIITSEKITVTSSSNKQDNKGISHHIVHDVNKLTPNILSKSSKLRSSKTMLVIDKATGKQKVIMTKSDSSNKDIKQPHKVIQPSQNSPKTEKFVILPNPNSPRPTRTQKIVIDPQTGKAHVVVEKGSATVSESKPVSAKLINSSADSKSSGGTVMIITNEQGTQSRIVLTPEHEKILFPNKQQPNLSQLKTITHLISTNTSTQQKSIITSVAAAKTQTRIVSKPQKSAIITSKGQLIVGGRLAPTTQNIAPLPEIRPATKRLAEPKKIAPMGQKQSSEPLIFLQKSGTVMQLTASQFEHLQRTGQIIQKVPAQEKLIVQKTITMSPTETLVPAQKPRARKQQSESAAPTKKIKHEINIAPAPAPVLIPAAAPALIPVPVPALTPMISTTTNLPVATNNSSNNNTASTLYPNMDNFEELLPTTAIARPTETTVAPTEQNSQAAVAPLSDGQLLAVPGEHFGGPQGSFYLCVEENGTFTAIDNRPLVLENNQLVPMPETIPIITPQPERRDILEAALANSDVFHAESTREEAPDFRDLNANVSVHCRVSETSTTLNQPIMTPVEVPTKVDSEPAVPSNLDDGLAVIGVTPHTVPTSLELPITITDPRIAPKTTDPLSNNNYRTSLLPSPSTEMTFVVTEDTDVSMVGPISMPLLTEEDSVGKSMPILIDEITERTISSVESTVGSPSSIDVRESETEDSQWPRRLLTPGSDISEASVEIPLQPSIQLSVSDLSHNNS